MIDVNIIEGKTQEELLDTLELDKVHYKVEEIPGKLFKGKKFVVRYVTKDSVKEYIKTFINNFASSLEKKINTEIRFSNECYNIMLISEDNAIVIGKDGKTLNSIQLLLRQSLNNATGLNIKINVDVGNYKSNKEKRLEHEIKNIAKEVISTKIEVKLDPMNSYERRLIHNIIGEYPELASESYGEEPTRYIVISYKED